MAIELVTFAEIKAFLGLEQSLITDYPALNLIKPLVQSEIEEYLGRELESKERSVTIARKLEATRMVKLVGIPVASVSALTIAGEDYIESDFVIKNYGIQLESVIKDQEIEVTYTGGYSSAPDSLKQAALIQTVYQFQTKEYPGATSVNVDGGSIKYPEPGLLPQVKKLLNRYLHPLKW